MTDEHNRNVFHAAAALGQPKNLTKLLASYPKRLISSALSTRDKQGLTPAQTAALHGNLRVLKLLIDAGTDKSGLSDVLRRQSQSNSPYRTLHRCLITAGGTERLPVGYADFEHFDTHHRECNWPLGVVDIAVSPSGLAAACIVQPINTFDRQVYFSSRMQPFSKVDISAKALSISCSSFHTMVVADDAVWTWGSPAFGLLGRECDSKKDQLKPGCVDGLIEYTEGGTGAYGALSGPIRGKPVEPLIGGATADNHCVAYTATKLWAWGMNSGQMLGRVPKGVIEEPILVADAQRKWGGRILAADCGESFTAVMLSNETVLVLQNDAWFRLDLHHKAVGLRARGKYVCVETDHGRLLRFGPMFDQQPLRLWKPKRVGLDAITCWDLGSGGGAVVAAVSGVYLRNSLGTETIPLKGFDGVVLRQISGDSCLTVFNGVHEFESADTGEFFGVNNEPQIKTSKQPEDLTLSADDGDVQASRAVVYGRCPSLKDEMTAVPGSSVLVYHTPKGLRFENARMYSVKDFLNYLYYGSDPQESTGRSLQRLVRESLGEGLYSSCQEFGDSTLIAEDGSHIAANAFVLAQCSPFFAARLSGRWPGKEVELNMPRNTIESMIRFIYTGKIFDNGESLEFVYEVWQASHQLIIGGLQERCEACINEMIDFTSVLAIFKAAPSSSRLSKMMLGIVVEHMDYFISEVGELETGLMEVIERAFASSQGSEPAPVGMTDLIEELSKRSREPKELKDTKDSKEAMSHTSVRSLMSSPPPSPPSLAQSEPAERTAQAKNEDSWTAAARKKRGSKSAPQPQSQPATPRAKPPAPTGIAPAASKPASLQVATPRLQPGSLSTGTRVRTPPSSTVKPTPLAPQALPALGSSQVGADQHRKERHRTSSSSHVRPKLSQKERRRLQKMEDPFAEPESSPPSSSSSPPTSNPWRQVKPVSSQPILQQLEMRKAPKPWAWLS